MAPGEARQVAERLNVARGPLDLDGATRLAWRPAWSIRSRRGALAAFRALFRREGS